MARQKGTANFSGTLEVLAGGPIDSRTVVPTLADLTIASNFPYAYVGLETYVVSENKKYRLIAADVTQSSNWEEIGSGGGGTEVEANPSGAATSELSKIQIASVIYSVVTKAVNDLTNYYTKTQVDDIVTAIKNSRFEVVSSLPTTNIKTNVIYLVPKSPAQTSNAKDEYINLNGTTSGWEKIGDTEIDLSGYVTTAALNTALEDYTTTSALNALLSDKQDAADKMTSADMDEVISPLPSVMSRRFKYSTEEQIVGEWIDGKPVYQKTINCGALPNTTTKHVSHGISNIKNIVNSIGYAKRSVSGDDTYIILPWVLSSEQPNTSVQVGVTIDNTNILISCYGDRSLFTESYITLQYTKTTD